MTLVMACLLVTIVVFGCICLHLSSRIDDERIKREIQNITIDYLMERVDVNKESIELQTKCIRDLNSIVLLRKGEPMRTITYTYDEEHPTNRDYLVAVLADAIDDGGASYVSVAEYNIDCPYHGYSNCLNEHEGNEYDTNEYKEGCIRCKLAWLDRGYDTYPSDDGVWERKTE